MSKVDDELTRRLHRAERQVDDDDLFESLLHRRSHRERVRRVQAAVLAVTVLAATAIAFVALQQAFGENGGSIGGTPSPTTSLEPEPSPSPSPTSPDPDIGLGFRLCHVSRLEGVDFLGDGAAGIAWVGTRVRENGSCREQVEARAVVAADFNGDEMADSWWGGIEYCLYCIPWVATDLDADGDQELVVLESSSSTPSYLVLTAHPDPAGRPQLQPVVVAPPGDEAARLPAGDPLRITTGGDEGFAGWVRCEGFPAAPVLVLTWRDHPIEGATMEVHETKLVLHEDGAAHITETNDHTAPVGTSIPGVSDAPACGVDWQILG